MAKAIWWDVFLFNGLLEVRLRTLGESEEVYAPASGSTKSAAFFYSLWPL